MPGAFRNLHHLLFGGEAVEPQSVRRVLTGAPPKRLLHVYGPTETTTFATWYEVTDVAKDARTVPIGHPVGNTTTYVLDARMEPVPIGVAGELYIGGNGLAREYLNRPELTAEKFVGNPFAEGRLYRTGDVVRYLSDGSIEFLGRVDHQVKLRGYRIELGEVEAVLGEVVAVKEAVVLLREDTPGHKRLVAYVVPKPGVSVTQEDVRDFLQDKLPSYMIPSAITMGEELPLTPVGKIDRRALLEMDVAEETGGAGFVPPESATEKAIAAIWSEVLGIDQIGVHDNFFALGGDSILCLQIEARAKQVGLQFTVRDVFQRQTVAELAAQAASRPIGAAEQHVVSGPVPLTAIQRWFFEQDLEDCHHFNQAQLLEVPADIDRVSLKNSLQHLIRHHDALRLRFRRSATGWEQVNAAYDEEVPFSCVDLSTFAPGAHAEAIERAASEVQASLNLSEGPLIRATLFDLGAERSSRLLIVVHHLAVDLVSWRILVEDLRTAYRQLSNGTAVSLPPKSTSFQQWANGCVEYAWSHEARREVDFWVNQPWQRAASLPVDTRGGANTAASARTVSVWLDEGETEALLRKVPTVYRTQINDVLLTALTRAMAQWTGSTALLVAVEGHGREAIRDDLDLTRTVGWFTAIYPVLLELEETASLAEALKSIKEQLRRIPNRGIGYGLLRYLGEHDIAAQLEALPEPQVSFNYLGQFNQSALDDAVFKWTTESSGRAHSPKSHRKCLLDVTGRIQGGAARPEHNL